MRWLKLATASLILAAVMLMMLSESAERSWLWAPLWAGLLIAVLLLACSVTVASGQEQTTSPDVALADAEALWRARKPKSYEFAVEVRCFCPDLAKTPPRFAVTDGEPRSLQQLESFSQKTYDYFNTVEKLFAAIRGRFARGRNKMVVQYHADLGYPLVADLDPNADIADDELFLRVSDFKVTGGDPRRHAGFPTRASTFAEAMVDSR